MKKLLVLIAMVLGVVSTSLADISVQTKIFDADSQPMLVGGFIENYSKQNVSKKGVIVSKNADDMIITDNTVFDNATIFLQGKSTGRINNPYDIRFIDCSDTNEEQFACALQFLMGNTDYYVKAFVIDNDNNILYGTTEKVHTKDYNRYNGWADYANVWYAFDHTLFDVVTDELIDPNNGFYYTTNEKPERVKYQTGTSYNTCYKLATEWNYKLWYCQCYHGTLENNSSKVVHLPVMSYSNGMLTIEKNPLDADKDISIYYSINGNYFRPENYTDLYNSPISITGPCTVYCYAISSDGYISYTNLYVIGGDAAEISVQTRILDANSQPSIVGGMIDGYSDGSVLKKGIIVSTNAGNIDYDASKVLTSPRLYEDKTNSEATNNGYTNKDYRIIDCTGIGKEQFWCTLKLLEGNTKYYIRAFAIQKDGAVVYGETLELVTQNYSRYNDSFDRANVWHAFDSTLFDLVTDEIIDPNDGFYYSTNENPTKVRHQVGTGYNTCYKYLTEWNYKLWYYHSAHCNQDKIVNTPVMTISDNKLFIEKNPLDADKDISIYYSINGNYFRPENYTDVYTAPIEITEPSTVYCYAISSDGYISYTNIYVVGDNTVENEFGEVADAVDLGLSVKWASWNVGADKPEGLGNLYAWGELSPKTDYSASTYKFYSDGYTKYGSVDNKYQLDSEDDVARQTWGDKWRIPTIEELKELSEKCTFTKTELNGVPVTKVTGPNGNFIYFPYPGNFTDKYLYYKNSIGSYWSSNLRSDSYAEDLDFISGMPSLNGDSRYHGQSIRPVYAEATSITPIAKDIETKGEMYNLHGQRIDKPSKGIYIKNGKKIIIR